MDILVEKRYLPIVRLCPGGKSTDCIIVAPWRAYEKRFPEGVNIILIQWQT